MKELFVSYTQAKELKELGFDKPCFGYWRNEYNGSNNPITYPKYIEQYDIDNDKVNFENALMLAPLKQQVFSWFREKHNLLGVIDSGRDDKEVWYIFTIIETTPSYLNSEIFRINKEVKTYEQAESECIDKLILLLKEKQLNN